MTPRRLEDIRAAFESALARPASERRELLQLMSETDPDLAREVNGLLSAHERRIGFIDRGLFAAPVAGPGISGPAAGSMIGPYLLLDAIGEGGMGEVWRAEQQSPVRRTVALKLIKAGMDTWEVIRRFESERQTLAIMNHPAIARVFDAGTTPLGRPYFVMEYVAGVPITAYCDRRRLSTRDRLRLFIRVCEGIQHAHQKAILHRDVKPSNILVVDVDGRPVPKIIDFGIARAVTPEGGDDTGITRAGTIIGTPDYMSPEQASNEGGRIDTRTDVYSLGVVLYELLVGARPFEFRGVPFPEVLRRLSLDAAPRPSTKFRVQGMDPVAAHNRRTVPKRLHRELRGDLDAIVVKALEKETTLRYDSAADFAGDIARFLRNEAVQARPAGNLYVARKYLWRHRISASAVATLVMLLAAFGIWQNTQIRRITRERDRADRIARFMTDMFRVSDPGESRGNQVRAREILDRASAEINSGLAKDPEMQAKLMSTMGRVYFRLGLYREAESLMSQSLEIRRRILGPEHPDTMESMNDLANALSAIGDRARVKQIDLQILAARKRILGPRHPDTLKSMNNLAVGLVNEGRYSEAGKLLETVYREKRQSLGPEHPSTLMSMENLGDALEREGRYTEAEGLQRGALGIKRRTLGSDHPDTLRGIQHLAETLYDEGRYSEAERLDREALKARTRVLGADHPDTLRGMIALANPLENEGRFAEAESLVRKAIEMQRRKLGPEHPDVMLAMNNLAGILADEGHYAEAERLDREVLGLRKRILGTDDANTLHSANRLALVLMMRGSLNEAQDLAAGAREAQSRYAGADNPETAMTTYTLACIAARRKHTAEALNLLRDAIDHGLKPNAALGIANDAGLHTLHGQPEFEALVAHARERAIASAGAP